MLATKLNMSSDEAEKWIVNLIRNAKLDAKIDALEVSFSLHASSSLLELAESQHNGLLA